MQYNNCSDRKVVIKRFADCCSIKGRHFVQKASNHFVGCPSRAEMFEKMTHDQASSVGKQVLTCLIFF